MLRKFFPRIIDFSSRVIILKEFFNKGARFSSGQKFFQFIEKSGGIRPDEALATVSVSRGEPGANSCP
jgi:hypothetical protein